MPSSAGQLPPGFTVAGSTTTVVLPSNALAQSITTGAKAKMTILGYDPSLSYLYARDTLPLIDRLVVTGTPPNVDVSAELVYPREHIIGADLAGSIFSVGISAEAALFIPRRLPRRCRVEIAGREEPRLLLSVLANGESRG